MITKICTKCGVEKPLSEYNNHQGGKHGVASQCRDCRKQYSKQYRKDNKEYVSRAIREWKINNPVKVKEEKRRWRLNNPDKVKEINKKYRLNNPEKVKARAKKWRASNIQRVRENKRRWRIRNIEYLKKRKKEAIANLDDGYVIGAIRKQCGLSASDLKMSDVTPDMIEMKRRNLKYYRELNQLKKITK